MEGPGFCVESYGKGGRHMRIRKAQAQDVEKVWGIYDAILVQEEIHHAPTGWERGKYPLPQTARTAFDRGELFVMEEDGQVLASAVINSLQAPEYRHCPFLYPAEDEQVMVLHTLVVHPLHAGRGIATRFVAFYEDYARRHLCTVSRMDTNQRNLPARQLYRKLGWREAACVPCYFNGIENVMMVIMEKKL